MKSVEGLDNLGDGASRDLDAVGELFVKFCAVPGRQLRQERSRSLALVCYNVTLQSG